MLYGFFFLKLILVFTQYPIECSRGLFSLLVDALQDLNNKGSIVCFMEFNFYRKLNTETDC